MSEQEKINIRTKINEGLKKSYKALLRRKAALGQDMVIADATGQPLVVSAADLLAKREAKK
jgi:hypothetical protein